jgi:hypothetical protein
MTYSEFQKSFTHFYLYHKLINPLGSEKALQIIHSFYTIVADKKSDSYFDYLERQGPNIDIILGAFAWTDSNEGHDFWSLVNHIIQNQ